MPDLINHIKNGPPKHSAMTRAELDAICARHNISIPGLTNHLKCVKKTLYDMAEGSPSAVQTAYAVRYFDKYGPEDCVLTATALRKVMPMREMAAHLGEREKIVYDAMNRRRPVPKRLSMACRWYMLEVKPKKRAGEVKRPTE